MIPANDSRNGIDSIDDFLGPVAAAIEVRPPFGAMARLSPPELRAEQELTLETLRRRPTLSARGLFATMDLLYGTPRTVEELL